MLEIISEIVEALGRFVSRWYFAGMALATFCALVGAHFIKLYCKAPELTMLYIWIGGGFITASFVFIFLMGKQWWDQRFQLPGSTPDEMN